MKYTLEILFILLLTLRNYYSFTGVKDDFLRCYTCVNKTFIKGECPPNKLKKQTCSALTELLNKNVIAGRPLIQVTYKCAHVKYIGKTLQQTFCNNKFIQLLLDPLSGKDDEKRGCVGIYLNYTFCQTVDKIINVSKVLYCKECNVSECNAGYKYLNKAHTINPNIIYKYAHLLITISLKQLLFKLYIRTLMQMRQTV